eukprot:CAMPEP_0206273028 /NCGR_PEP_ID=MMETSP0047_2-20121206/34359_1 /ASSEMBLY_ACC=CAM_ASM_000192 /TAXON_ID=195065 /ORGANISM="Chroomonas mesostigmatica_cf, Strain CCMP1168" /LENGTH=51 /DNA_ID=CAMNT_0053702061 /DNA_START=22 /DNA_END=174 /DNA_ORIENTATION=+
MTGEGKQEGGPSSKRGLQQPPDRIAELAVGAGAYSHKSVQSALSLVHAPMA